VQNKKELTISSLCVDKMKVKGDSARHYNCIFTADETAPENLRNVLLINILPAAVVCRQIFIKTG
jgi:hypothetical protein